MATLLGIDIGGTGIKGAPVDTRSGELITERHRIPTPQPSAPDAVADVVAEIAAFFDWTGPLGVTFPAVVRRGVVETAANVEKEWVGVDVATLFGDKLGAPVTVLNDADAAGSAEIAFGAGRERQGTVLVVTLGTGIGSALFTGGHLVPNTELGHLQIRGKEAERRAAESVRESKALTWEQWAKRLNEYFDAIEQILWLDLIVFGGGVIKKSDKFLPLLETRAELVPAQLLNNAGIVGAALAATQAGG
jgi:polyphosphate glucokinase